MINIPNVEITTHLITFKGKKPQQFTIDIDSLKRVYTISFKQIFGYCSLKLMKINIHRQNMFPFQYVVHPTSIQN